MAKKCRVDVIQSLDDWVASGGTDGNAFDGLLIDFQTSKSDDANAETELKTAPTIDWKAEEARLRQLIANWVGTDLLRVDMVVLEKDSVDGKVFLRFDFLKPTFRHTDERKVSELDALFATLLADETSVVYQYTDPVFGAFRDYCMLRELNTFSLTGKAPVGFRPFTIV